MSPSQRRRVFVQLAACLPVLHLSLAIAQVAPARPALPQPDPRAAPNAAGLAELFKKRATQPDPRAALNAAVADAMRQLGTLTAGIDKVFSAERDFTPTLERLEKSDARAFALVNYLVSVPDWRTLGDTLSYAEKLAVSFDQQANNVRALRRYFEANTTAIRSFDNILDRPTGEAMAIALQEMSARILALEAMAASGRDPQAAANFAKIVELAHDRGGLDLLLDGARLHYKVCEMLRRRLRKLEKLHEPEPEDYVAAAQITALLVALRAADPDAAQRGVAEVDRKLQTALANQRRAATLNELARMFSGGDAPSNPSNTVRIQRCTERYAPVTQGTDLFSGSPTTYGGEYLGKDCSSE